MKLILRILVNAAAIWITSLILEAFTFSGTWWQLLVVALIFGIVNALVRPIVKLLTLPINIFTLGLFTLVINALMLWLTVWLSGDLLTLSGGFLQQSLWVFVAALIISIISTVLNWFIPDD